MQQDARPIEGSRHDNEMPTEMTTPTRTGDDLPVSDVTRSEVKTMYAVPAIFLGVVLVIAIVLAAVLLGFHH